MIKKFHINLIIYIILGYVLTANAQQEPQRILFVGNSYFYYNNSLHNHVKALVEASQPELSKTLEYKSATIGGAELEHHQIEWLIQPQKIGVKKPFEWVILAGNSADALDANATIRFVETVKKFDHIIRSQGAKTALYMVHAYVAPHPKENPNNIRKVEKMYSNVSQEIGATLLPVGLAFEESYKRRPDLLLHSQQDGSHPSLYGTYLAACVVYSKIYNKTPVGNSYDIYSQVPKDVKEFLQRVAWDVVQNNSAN